MTGDDAIFALKVIVLLILFTLGYNRDILEEYFSVCGVRLAVLLFIFIGIAGGLVVLFFGLIVEQIQMR